jgi:hypothetical protein
MPPFLMPSADTLPPYGDVIQQNVYYVDNNLPNSNVDYSCGSYPMHDNDCSGKMASTWKDPFVILVAARPR